MDQDVKKATITIKQKEVTVDFKGLWTRSLIDAAYRTMLRSLPRHVSEWKAKLESREKPTSKEELE